MFSVQADIRLVPIADIQLFSTIAAVSGLWRELEPQRPSIIMCSTHRKVTETSMLRHATIVCALGAALLFPLPVLAALGTTESYRNCAMVSPARYSDGDKDLAAD